MDLFPSFSHMQYEHHDLQRNTAARTPLYSWDPDPSEAGSFTWLNLKIAAEICWIQQFPNFCNAYSS